MVSEEVAKVNAWGYSLMTELAVLIVGLGCVG